MKLVLLVAFIAVLSVWAHPSAIRLLATALSLAMLTASARLRFRRVVSAAFFVLPFVGFFAFVLYVSGQPERALLILQKTYLSTWGVLLLMGTTNPGEIAVAAIRLRVPPFLVEVTQLTFRYLFVLREEAGAMQVAFQSRAGRPGWRAVLASSGMVAGLFVRSQERSQRVYQSMLSRGYTGESNHVQRRAASVKDYVVLFLGLLILGSTLLL